MLLRNRSAGRSRVCESKIDPAKGQVIMDSGARTVDRRRLMERRGQMASVIELPEAATAVHQIRNAERQLQIQDACTIFTEEEIGLRSRRSNLTKI